jgi:hypothetical protein
MDVCESIQKIFQFYFGFIPEKTLYRFSFSKEESDEKLIELHRMLIEFYESDMTQPIRERLLKMSYRNILYSGRFYFKRCLTILRKLGHHIGYNLEVKSYGKDRRLFILETLENPVILRNEIPPIPFKIIHWNEPRMIKFDPGDPPEFLQLDVSVSVSI